MPRSMLVLLSEMLHDSPGDAAAALRALTQGLAAEAFDVMVLQTTATRAPRDAPAPDALRAAGFDVRVDRQPSAADGRALIRYAEGDVRHVIMDVGERRPQDWQAEHGLAFTRLMTRILRQHRPELLLAGDVDDASETSRARWQMARERGCAVVAAVVSPAQVAALAGVPMVDALLVLNDGAGQSNGPVNGAPCHRIPGGAAVARAGESVRLQPRCLDDCCAFLDLVERRA